MKKWLPILISLMILPLKAFENKTQTLLEQAWQAWAKHDQPAVETYFKSALEIDPLNTRARTGLYYLYEMQEKYGQAWQQLKSILKNAANPHAWLYPALSSATAGSVSRLQREEWIGFLKDYLDEQKPPGVLKYIITQSIGRTYESMGEWDNADDYYKKSGPVTEWKLLGPFDNISASGFGKIFPPEEEINYQRTCKGKNDISIKWIDIPMVRRDQWIDFDLYYRGFDESVFFALTHFRNPEKRKIQLRIGTSGALKVFLDDREIFADDIEKDNDLDTYILQMELQAGWHRILLKLAKSEDNRANFLLRITDTKGEPLQDIIFDKQRSTFDAPAGQAHAQIIANFAESYFENLIKQTPQQVENYILLAQSLNRNDKAARAEGILKKALEIAAGNPLVYFHLLESYRRQKKNDDYRTTMNLLYNERVRLPFVLKYKFNTFIENKEQSKAQKVYDQYTQLCPQSADAYQMKIKLLSLRKDREAMSAAILEAWDKYPYDLNALVFYVTYIVLSEKKYDKAIAAAEKLTEKYPTRFSCQYLANLYLRAQNFDGWQKNTKKMAKRWPDAINELKNTANVYFQVKQFQSAKEIVERLITVAPYSYDLWAFSAIIERSMDNSAQAVENFRRSLALRATNYDAREELRNTLGKPPVFDSFSSFKTDSLIKSAPSQEQYPNDGALILLDDTRRVVYPKGASEVKAELLVKLFNDHGIDVFKEYWINSNAYLQQLIIDKAVTIKADGSEIDADVSGSQVVFKSLEANDYIYLTWRQRDYFKGDLAQQFWDEAFFESWYPAKIIRYAVLTPPDYKFSYKAQRVDAEPVQTKKVETGVIHSWIIKDQPAVNPEYQMPRISDFAKKIVFSSIPDWGYISKWYADVTVSKIKPTREIEDKVKEILASVQPLTEEEKIARLHRFVTENIHYSNVSFRQSALIPQKARDVLNTRMGDCKDMATLFLSMLQTQDIPGKYVLVNTIDSGLNKTVLPSIAFNHVIVKIERPGKDIYADLTARNYALNTLPFGDYGAFSLEIGDGAAGPGYLPTAKLFSNNIFRKGRIEIGKKNEALIHKENVRSGYFAGSFRSTYRDLGRADRNKEMLEILSKEFSNVQLDTFFIEHIDQLKPTLRYHCTFRVQNYLAEAGSFKLLKIPWTDEVKPMKMLSYEKRHYDIENYTASDTISEKIEIVLPKGYRPFEFKKHINFDSKFGFYDVHFSLKENLLTGTRKMIYRMKTIPKEDYADFKAFYNKLVKADQTQILLKKI